MKLPRLSLPLLLAALAHSPSAAADDWLQNLQKGDWQKAIEGAVNEAAPARRTQRPTPGAPAPRASPQRRPDATTTRAQSREARAARRAAASAQRSAVTRRAAPPPDTGQRAERRSRRR
ncbi:MAG: hypothetical protein DWQ11_16950 [Proteobacteria bacterium]|nr:MAG: hypothetical protein DWQ11_16950 [Pseudomonadota bacterium]